MHRRTAREQQLRAPGASERLLRNLLLARVKNDKRSLEALTERSGASSEKRLLFRLLILKVFLLIL